MSRRLTTVLPTGKPMPREEWLALREGVTDSRKQQFLTALAESYSVTVACDAASISRQTAYRWRAEDAVFSDAWDEAHTRCVDKLEEVMYRKAIAGEVVPGIVMLKGALPFKYKDNAPFPVPAQTSRTSLRFLTDSERDGAIDCEYRLLPAHGEPS